MSFNLRILGGKCCNFTRKRIQAGKWRRLKGKQRERSYHYDETPCPKAMEQEPIIHCKKRKQILPLLSRIPFHSSSHEALGCWALLSSLRKASAVSGLCHLTAQKKYAETFILKSRKSKRQEYFHKFFDSNSQNLWITKFEMKYWLCSRQSNFQILFLFLGDFIFWRTQ